jgi:transcriptional regulator with XRE-family HTH domain
MEGCFMFGDNLRVIRKRKDITQAALAKELGVTQQTIGKWETGVATPPLETIARVADYFQIPTTCFLEAPVAQPSDKGKSLAFNTFMNKVDGFHTLTVYLTGEQEEAAYKAVNKVLEMLSFCLLDTYSDGKFTFDEESFSLYMTTIEKIALFSDWIESKAREHHVSKSADEAYNNLIAVLSPSERALAKERDKKYSEIARKQDCQTVCEQIDLLFSELKNEWINNARRVIMDSSQEADNDNPN